MPELVVEGGSINIAIGHDGARNTLVDVTGEVLSRDLLPTVVIDVATLYAEPGYRITRLRIDDIQYFVDPGLLLELLWEGEDDKHLHCIKVTGRGTANYEKMGGRQNPHTGATGNIMVATSGYTKGRKNFSLQLELIKQFT